MDYANRQRLKIWARAHMLESDIDAELLARLQLPEYKEKIESVIILTVEAIDWNCPQHISPRYSTLEISQFVEPLMEENRSLKIKLAQALALAKT